MPGIASMSRYGPCRGPISLARTRNAKWRWLRSERRLQGAGGDAARSLDAPRSQGTATLMANRITVLGPLHISVASSRHLHIFPVACMATAVDLSAPAASQIWD